MSGDNTNNKYKNEKKYNLITNTIQKPPPTAIWEESKIDDDDAEEATSLVEEKKKGSFDEGSEMIEQIAIY